MLKQVIVVGGGLSGLSAAHTVVENGGRVLLLEKMPFCGGNSTKATSGINAAGTKTQIRNGVPDTASTFERDMAISASKGVTDKSYPLCKVLTNNSDAAIEWLQNRFGLDLSLVGRLGGHSEPRTHRGKERFPGMTITYALLEALEDIEKKSQGKTARISLKSRAKKLIYEDGNVIGLEYEKDGKTHTEFGVVVICSGGFGADYEKDSLLFKYTPNLKSFPTTNGAHCTGDGIKMASEIGANTVDMEFVQVHPTGLVMPNDPNNKVKFLAAEALRGCGAIMLDAEGNRFCDELGRRDYVSGEMLKGKAPFRLILNSAASKEIEWHCKHYVGRRLFKKYTNGEQIAKDIGCTKEHLEETFNKYNKCAEEKKDPFGKKFFKNAPFKMNDNVFHVGVITPVVHYTMGGLVISENGECMRDQKPIRGLYAAGEVAGGVHGKNRLGGNALCECVVIGRVAGKSAVTQLFGDSLDEKKYNAVNRLGLVRNQLNAEKEYSVEEVAKHNSEKDCWVILWDKVYDVSKFLADHPGGVDAITIYAGQDATEQFDLMHQDSVLKRYGPKYVIGKVKK